MATRKSRVYIHDRCGAQTEVSGFDFYRLSNAFFYVGGATRCVECGIADLNSVSWTDTKESLQDYRRRQRSTRAWVWFAWLLFIVGGAIAGFLILPQFGHANIDRNVGVVFETGLGAFAGIALGYFGVPFLYHLSIGNDPRDID